MNGSNIGAGHIHAQARHQELLIESELNRRIKASGVDTSGPVVRLAGLVRQGAGGALIRAGEWVGGERIRRAANEDLAARNTLRPAC